MSDARLAPAATAPDRAQRKSGRMRTLHVTFSFPPDPPGGTELYVEQLCRALAGLHVDSVVVAPGESDRTYDVRGLRVRRFGPQGVPSLLELYTGDPRAAASVARVLADEAPDLLHQHALSPACSPLVADEARRRGIPVVFTYHTPTATCQRGTLMEMGSAVCDGRMERRRCTACTLHGLGLSRPASLVLSSVPVPVGRAVGRFGLSGRGWTAVRMSSLIERRHASVRRFLALVDKVVVLAPWTRALMLANGVPPGRIVMSPHGIAHDARQTTGRQTSGGARLKVAHLGRVDPVKGTGVLIDAVRSLPEAPLDLDVFGVVQGASGEELLGDLRARAAGDVRIRFLPRVDHADVVRVLARYDLVAVPSQWMETGPLVVLEAFAAGRPVIGSALGGIADKVRDGVDGILVSPFDSVDAWRAALDRCVRDREWLAGLGRAVPSTRPMAEVAAEMAALYRQVLVAHE